MLINITFVKHGLFRYFCFTTIIKIMKKLITLLVCLSTTLLFSQAEKTNKQAIGIHAGTGIGVDYTYKLTKSIAATARYSKLPFKYKGYSLELDDRALNLDTSIDVEHLDLFFSFGKVLRLVVGAGYFTSNKVDVDLTFEDSIFIGDVEFTSDDIGMIQVESDWGQLLPYIGFAIGRAVPKKGLGLAFELGTYYNSKGPGIKLNATGIIENTSDQEVLVQNSLEDNKFLPFLNLRLAYAF